MTQLFVRTLRDDPADADVDSHRLLVRGGYIRKVAAGIYSWLPLGLKVLHNVERIVRDEMDASGAQELSLPITQPLELWDKSGRNAAYGDEMFRLRDRKDTSFCLSPTAEEVVTVTVANEYSSYRDLPVNLYQINWKYRDERRPRFGLLRGREFLMKDAYSFDVDEAALRVTYQTMFDAYTRIFTRCGLTFRAVEGEAGQIGGDVNHEFMAVAAVGEDDFVWCTQCDYAANVEVARRRSDGSVDANASTEAMEKVHTPGTTSISSVSELLGVAQSKTLKAIAFVAGDAVGLALVPGDREVNEEALARSIPGVVARLFTEEDFAVHSTLPKGYIGANHPVATHVIADPSIATGTSWVMGANEIDHHARNAVAGRDFLVTAYLPIVSVATGDGCPKCDATLSVDRGIEVGQVFQIGTKYSEALGATYSDADGNAHPMVMGCYGIGISRVVAAVVEEHHDDKGMMWPAALAPYHVHLIALTGKGAAAAEVATVAESLYSEMQAAGISVLYDDRETSPGVKFADADLLGMPVQLTVGAKGLARGVVERKIRASGERDDLPLDDIVRSLR